MATAGNKEVEPPRPQGDATGVPLTSGEWLLLLGLALGARQLRQRYLATP